MTTISPTLEQKKVIDLQGGAYLITAPPGSGKTMVLTKRIIRLLQDSPGQSFRILALTFTTKAAEEMGRRIEEEIGEEWRRVQASTFHAFCLDVLQHYGERAGVDPNVTIYETDADRLEVLIRGLEDDGYGVRRTQDERRDLFLILAEIGRLKRDLVPPDAASSELIGGIPLNDAYSAYNRTLRLYGAVDFDDLLLCTHQLFTEHDRVADLYRRIYQFVLVDEAQDMSLAQYEVLAALLGDRHRNILLVADADQSIYGFAGASRGFLERFAREFNAERLPLVSNFRCAVAIVAAANRLIEGNPDRLGRPENINAATGAIGSVAAKSFATEQAEGNAVVECITKLLSDGLDPDSLSAGESSSVVHEQICVLARSRYALKATLEELKQSEVPHRFGTGEAGIFESETFRGILYALRVLANPRDVMGRAKLLAALGRVDVETDDQLAEKTVTELFDGLSGHDDGWSKLAPLFSRTANGQLDPPSLLDDVTGIDLDWIADDLIRDLTRRDQETFTARWRAHSVKAGMAERSLRGLLGELALAGRSNVEGPGVRVLSIHAVKGLEFRAVILVGMNEGVFPDFRAASAMELEEERRNAYVAVTRASRFLLLTRPSTRVTSYGNVRPQQASRFIAEMGIV